MTTRTPTSDRLPLPARLLLAPAIWLERSRGRTRLAIASLYLAILIVFFALLWRRASLNNLPDVGDPFDVAEFDAASVVPDDENAAIAYRKALAGHRGEFEDANNRNPDDKSWAGASPKLRAWIESNRETFAAWQAASERPKASWVRPGEVSFSSDVRDLQDLRSIARIALVEGSRRGLDGDPSSAAGLYRAALLSTRHAMQSGGIVPRLISVNIFRQVADRLFEWSDDPKVDSSALRKVLDAAVHAEAMTPPPSEMVRVDYLVLAHELRDLDLKAWDDEIKEHLWYNHLPGATPIRLFARREPERSLRVVRLVYANLLAYCDRPTLPPPASTFPWLYRTDPSAPRAALALSPEEIVDWNRSTILAQNFLGGIEQAIGPARGDLALVRSIQVTLAEQLYRREHAGSYPRNLGALVGPYLKRLPEGYAPNDPASTGPEPKEATPKPR